MTGKQLDIVYICVTDCGSLTKRYRERRSEGEACVCRLREQESETLLLAWSSQHAWRHPSAAPFQLARESLMCSHLSPGVMSTVEIVTPPI
jgi:hypothetical protein